MRVFFRYFLPLGLIGLSVLLVVAMTVIAQGKRPERKPEGQQALLVEAVPARIRSLNFMVTTQGTVRPRTETAIVSEVGGKVVSVSPKFIAGGFFRKGEELLKIDPSDYEAALQRALANLASRQARLADEEARAEQALKDWRNLGRQGEPSDLVLRKPQLADARANVLAAEADVQKARRDLERTRISVPYDGLVREKLADLGQYVTPGTRVGVTFAVDTAEVRLPLSANDMAFLDLPTATGRVDEPVPVALSADAPGSSGSWQAGIVRTEGVVDERSRVIYAVAEVPDPYGVLGISRQPELKVGTFVRADIQGRFVEDVVELPRRVLRADNTVLVATAERELEIRPVSVVRAEPDRVFLDDGLEAGELVITTPLDAPIPGTRLRLSDDSGEASAGETEAGDAVAST